MLTQAPVIVTITHIFAVYGMRGHLPLVRPYPHALKLGQVRPSTRLELRARATLQVGLSQQKRHCYFNKDLCHISCKAM